MMNEGIIFIGTDEEYVHEARQSAARIRELGDWDITTGDKKLIKKYQIDKLKLGDLVYLENCDNTYGREYITGAGSIGIIVHSDCIKMGHGPGVTTILSSKNSEIIPIINPSANIAKFIKK